MYCQTNYVALSVSRELFLIFFRTSTAGAAIQRHTIQYNTIQERHCGQTWQELLLCSGSHLNASTVSVFTTNHVAPSIVIKDSSFKSYTICPFIIMQCHCIWGYTFIRYIPLTLCLLMFQRDWDTATLWERALNNYLWVKVEVPVQGLLSEYRGRKASPLSVSLSYKTTIWHSCCI